MIIFPPPPPTKLGVFKVPVVMLPIFPEIGVLGELCDNYTGKWYSLHELAASQLMIEQMLKEAQSRGSKDTSTQPTE